MLLAVLSFSLRQSAPLSVLIEAARKRDVQTVEAMSAPSLKGKFRFLKVNGAYDTGRFGWRVEELTDPATKARYVIFTTRITSECIGDQVFRWDGSRILEYVPESDGQGVQADHHDFKLRFEPAEKRAFITDEFRFTSARDGSFFARFSEHYKVRRVSFQGREVAFAQAGGVVALHALKGTKTYRIEYDGVVNLPGFAGSISENEVLLTNDYWYPMVARDPATYSVEATVPADWKVVAQGEQIPTNERSTFRYEMKLPVVYFSFSAGKFQQARSRVNGRDYVATSTVLEGSDLLRQNEINPAVIEFFDKYYAPYPFSSWGVMDTPAYGGGALEAYSFATYGSGWLPDEDAHEPSHTWFGGIINNTYLKSLWNESFAVFSEGVFAREQDLGNRAERRLAFVSDSSPSSEYNVATCAWGDPSIGPAAVGLGYGKGAKVLQMLEQELGAAKMKETLQTWLKVHPKGEPGEWEDYEKVVDQVTSKSYKWFFDQWIRKTGWADFEIESCKWQDGQINAHGKFKGQPFVLKCDVMVEDALGKRSFYEVRIGPTPDSDHFFVSIPVAKKPVLVSFDPWRRLLRTQKADETPLQLENALARVPVWKGPGASASMAEMSRGKALNAMPEKVGGVLYVGDPNRNPRIMALCQQAGFRISGDRLTYKGTTIDLNTQGAAALVPQRGGGWAGVAVGNPSMRPRVGRAKLALVDRLGRFLRGDTEPKRNGFLTFKP